MAIIEVDHVTKEFQLGQLQSLKTTALNGLRQLAGRPLERRPPFKALDDVSFSVEQGEVLGIIGHNGAGKSTLLKLLANISKPTSGRIAVKGKVAPLIEVGAGLVGDLTGRENTFLNGSILGIPKAEIARKLDEIVAFAELEQFIDTPIKRYSSGMQVRLGFAIATSVDSDILIVDEVLAVGDLAFQRKCFDRMEDVIRHQGRTVLLVSHNIRQVERMSRRVLLLSHGAIQADGDARPICDLFYQASNQSISTSQKMAASSRVLTSGEVEILAIAVLNERGEEAGTITPGGPLRIRIRFKLREPIERPEFHVGTHTTDFVYLTGESSAVLGPMSSLERGEHQIEHLIPHFPLVPGTYGIRFAVLDGRGRVLFHGESLRTFSVAARPLDAPLQDELRIIEVPVRWEIDGRELCRPGGRLFVDLHADETIKPNLD